MAFGRACAPGRVEPSSGGAARRGGIVSPRRGRYFASLRGRSEFRKVRRIGRRCRVGGVEVIVAVGQPGLPRVAVVAGKKVGGAVDRNRAKRRLRAAIAQAPVRGGHDYVVIATREVVGIPFDDLLSWVREAVEV